MRFYFVRHAESEGNTTGVLCNRPPGPPLTDTGLAQAHDLAQRLGDEALTGLYCSPLLRAIQTAEALSERLDLPYQMTDALRDYDMGIYENSQDPAAWQANHDLFIAWTVEHQPDRRIEGGESLNDMRRRFEPFIDALLAAHRDDARARLALISHGGVYLALLPALLANVPHEWALRQGLSNTGVVVAEPGEDGLICLSWDGRAPPPGDG